MNSARQNLLLEQDRTESGVESTDSLTSEHLSEASNETIGVCWVGNETDTGGLERAQGNIGEELGGGGRCQVNGSSVLLGGLISENVDGLLLE